jgi:hypothetical protein
MKDFLIIIMIILSGTIVLATQLDNTSEWDSVIDVDVDMPFYNFLLPVPIMSKITKNAKAQIIGFRGFNLIQLGYYSKTYFSPLRVNELNAYLNFGTVLLFVPYVDLGIDYVSSSGFYAGIYIPVAFLALNWIRSFFHKKSVPLAGVNFGFYY